MLRRISALFLLLAVLALAGCHHNKVKNPIADVNSKQPDKVLFDRAMDAMKKAKYDVARLTLQTLINTYPDSEYIARAKLAVGDSWYAEGGTTAWQQAELEYRDFETFFPNMPEAAEAQLKIADIHYAQMEKPDRDFTHAKRAEEEYLSLIKQYPDSKLIPKATERLREVQEVLAEREYRVGKFYYMRESWAASIARLKSVTDTYPLYSKADDALMLLGAGYEKEIDAIRAAKMGNEADAYKQKLIEVFTDNAASAYDRVIQRYPVGGMADKARERLTALHRPVPTPTAEAIAMNKAEEDSREERGRISRVMENIHKAPDMSQTSRVGEPTTNFPAETSAAAVAAQASKVLQDMAQANAARGNNAPTGDKPGSSALPPNQAPPRTGDQPQENQPATTAAGAGDSSTATVERIPSGTSAAAPPAAAQSADQGGVNALRPAAAAPVMTGIEDLAPTTSATPPANTPPASTTAPAATQPAPAPAATQPAAPAVQAPPPMPAQINQAAGDSADSGSNQAVKGDSTSNKKHKKKKDKDNKPAQPATPPSQ